MPVDLQKIEDSLEDISKNMATKSEVIKLIDDEVAKDKEERDAKIISVETEAKAAALELQEANKALEAKIKNLMRTRFNAIKTPAGMYNGVWGDLETAKTAGLFILASVFGNQKAKELIESKGLSLDRFTGNDKEKAMGEDVSSTGGILVPTELIPNLILLIEKYGVFRRNALEWPMSSDSAIAPKLTSGLTVYCPGAGVAPTASDLSFGSVGLNAKKWITLTALDSELTEDAAIAVGEVVGLMIGQAFAKQEDLVGFLGDGTETYFGHTGITGALRKVDATIGNIKSLVVGAGNAYGELTLANFETLVGVLPDYADDGNAKWFCHRLFYFTVMVRLALAAGGASATEIAFNRTTKEKYFLNYPVDFAQAMPKTAANDQICTVLGNLKQGAYLGDRRKLTIDRSTEAYFTTDQIGIRGTERVAPSVHGVGDTTDAGPICGMITAGS